MTTLEIVLIGVLWVFVGIFISYKRDWYKYEEENEITVFTNILLAPGVLAVSFIRVYCIDKWNNN